MSTIRAVLFNLFFVGWTVLLGIAGFWVRLARRDHALDLARLWVVGTIRLLRTVGGIPILVSGRERLGDGTGRLVASEHRAGIDSLVWLAIVRRPSYVMKEELRRIPLVGPLLEPAGMIAIDRKGGASALRLMLRRGRAALDDGRTVVIFPEGTRAKRRGDVPLAGGITALAGRGAHPVLPVATNSGEVWGPGFLLRARSGPGRPPAIRLLIGDAIRLAPGEDPRDAIARAWCDADIVLGTGGGDWTRL